MIDPTIGTVIGTICLVALVMAMVMMVKLERILPTPLAVMANIGFVLLAIIVISLVMG